MLSLRVLPILFFVYISFHKAEEDSEEEGRLIYIVPRNVIDLPQKFYAGINSMDQTQQDAAMKENEDIVVGERSNDNKSILKRRRKKRKRDQELLKEREKYEAILLSIPKTKEETENYIPVHIPNTEGLSNTEEINSNGLPRTEGVERRAKPSPMLYGGLRVWKWSIRNDSSDGERFHDGKIHDGGEDMEKLDSIDADENYGSQDQHDAQWNIGWLRKGYRPHRDQRKTGWWTDFKRRRRNKPRQPRRRRRSLYRG